MRKINLTNYNIQVDIPEPGIVPYNVKNSIINILFHPDLNLNGVELLSINKLANKVEEAEKEILLEEVDYLKIKTAVETITGYNRNDIEFVRRILEAEEIEVVEK